MNLLLLPGNSAQNEEWTIEVEQALSPIFSSTELQKYEHWDTGEKIIDIDKELERITSLVSEWKEYAVFAKSAGTLLATKGVLKKKIQPERCIFIGVPIHWARENNFDADTWFGNYSIPTLFIQKSHDPFFSFNELKEFLTEKRVTNHTLREVEGDSHHYEDINLLKTEIEKFVSK